MRKHIGIILVGAMAAFGAGCSEDGSPQVTGGTGGTAGGGGNGGSTGLCATPGEEVTLPAVINGDTTLTADCDYALDTLTYVESGTLSIEAGVTVFGLSQPGQPAGLVITQNARIDAVGTAEAPIVFTSGNPEGERVTGDWAGVVLLGKARLSFGGAACNGEAGECVDLIEGLDPGETRGQYGGDDDTHDCGTMQYVLIQFAGFELTADNELNALTLGGCGSDTTISYVQAHRGKDDAFEMFGGTANLDHIIASGMDDDGVDWDQGFRGTINYFVVDHYAGGSSDPRGMETDNNGNAFDTEPRSNPIVNYGTLLGCQNASPCTTDRGIVNREGTYGAQSGLVVYGFASAGYDLRDTAGQTGWPDGIFIADSCFMANNPNWPEPGTNCEDAENSTGDCNDPVGVVASETFDESTELADADLGNFQEDPGLSEDSDAGQSGGVPNYALSNPNCIGAFGPEGTDWTTGWSAHPVD